MIKSLPQARSYARGLKRHLKTFGFSHIDVHDMAARTIGQRDWRTLAMETNIAAARDQIETRLKQELRLMPAKLIEDIVVDLLPPASAKAAAPPARPYPHFEKDDESDEPMHAFNGKQLETILTALRREPWPCRNDMVERIDHCIAEGWFPLTSIQDILEAYDQRLQIQNLGIRLSRLMKCLGYPLTNSCHRPSARVTMVGLNETMRATDFAAFAIHLEQLGFRTPARLLVTRLLPAVKRMKVISQNEIRILWYDREEGRIQIKFLAPDIECGNGYDEGKLSDGYRYIAQTNDDGVGSLEIRGPRHRNRSKRS